MCGLSWVGVDHAGVYEECDWGLAWVVGGDSTALLQDWGLQQWEHGQEEEAQGNGSLVISESDSKWVIFFTIVCKIYCELFYKE